MSGWRSSACVLSPLLVVERAPRSLRFMVIAGLGAFVAYTIIRYKTPWCIISIIWPFFFVFGAVVERCWRSGAARRRGRRCRLADARIAALLLGHSAYWSGVLNFVRYDDENEPYVYVQTSTGREQAAWIRCAKWSRGTRATIT